MDDQSDRLSIRRQELVELANAMLCGGINLIEGVRRICALRFAIEDPENEVFLPLRAIESETDAFPLGAMRSNCNAEYLKRADSEMESYLADARDDILQACREIVTAMRRNEGPKTGTPTDQMFPTSGREVS